LKILVTGANGQLGTDIIKHFNKDEVYGYDVDVLDITDIKQVVDLVKQIKPELIINCAAYTNVDGCEQNEELAYKVNAIGARNLAVAALETNSKLLHISTDFVFDGCTNKPYLEFDTPNPLSIYGKSKFAGEELIRQICPRHYILRTAWLYGKNGNNFVKTMLKLGQEKKTLTVVDDQIGSPTFTEDLIGAISEVIKTDAYGTYHATNNGFCSWNEFAKKIFEYAGMQEIEVLPISTEELGRPAKRPQYSVLRNFMLEAQYNYKMRNWEEALKEYFAVGLKIGTEADVDVNLNADAEDNALN
jgi:dTDP-4-dehydrorhamnose reductase